MQKIVSAFLIGLLTLATASSVGAQSKKPAGKVSKPVIVSTVVKTHPKTVVGLLFSTPTTGFNGFGMDGVLKIDIDKRTDLLFGGSLITSSAGGSVSQLRLSIVGMHQYTGSSGTVSPHFAGLLQYISGAANISGINVLNIGFGWGIHAPIGPETTLIANIYLIQYGSQTGPTPALTMTNISFLTPSIAITHAL